MGTASVRAEQAELALAMRAEGATWAQVAESFRQRWGCNARVALRLARGWSQSAVADAWSRRWPDDPKTFKNISTWERWPHAGHAPSLVVLDRLAQLYQCAVADLVADFGDYGHLDNQSLAVNDEAVLNRRALITALGGSLASVAMPSLRSPKRVAPELADYFDAQLRSHYQADMLLGPHLLIETVSGQYQAICQTADLATGHLHTELLRIGTTYAALAGWLYQDIGDLARASAWRAETLDMAHRSGDLQLVSYALTNKAMVRVEVGDGPGAVDLAHAGLANSAQLLPKVRILALAQAAHGHSLTGRRDDCDRALDEVAELIGEVHDDYPWGNAFRRTPGYLEAQRATCYGRLGLAEEAASLWNQVLGQQPSSHRRDSGVYLARYATALFAAGEPTEATRPAAQAVGCFHETGSARLRLQLVRLRDMTAPSRSSRAGQDLYDVLHEVA